MKQYFREDLRHFPMTPVETGIFARMNLNPTALVFGKHKTTG